jgi:hypothetical protein
MIALFLSVVAAGLVLNWALDDADGQDAAPDGDDGDPPPTPAGIGPGGAARPVRPDGLFHVTSDQSA